MAVYQPFSWISHCFLTYASTADYPNSAYNLVPTSSLLQYAMFISPRHHTPIILHLLPPNPFYDSSLATQKPLTSLTLFTIAFKELDDQTNNFSQLPVVLHKIGRFQLLVAVHKDLCASICHIAVSLLPAWQK